MGSLLIGRVHLSWGSPHSYIWRHRLAVRTQALHACNPGSNPGGVTSASPSVGVPNMGHTYTTDSVYRAALSITRRRLQRLEWSL